LGDLNARLMLIFLSIGWGVTWPIMKIALIEIPPLSMRMATAGIGAVTLFVVARLRGHNIRIAGKTTWAHVAIGGVLNIVGFSLFSAFAQLSATTARVTILTYTMPIWAGLLAWLFLGERLTIPRSVALTLCASGLAVLIYPLTSSGIPGGILLAIGAGVSWAAGTVYLKWARIGGDSVGFAAWQVVIGFVVIAACLPIFEGSPHLWPVSGPAIFGVVFTGIVGNGFAYVLWFEIIHRLPAMTASLGVLSVPVIGVVASMIVLGERPTFADIVGFGLIFAASACVMIWPQEQIADRAE
jgi:drug/metabolite transporter (DMT)-like permease